jgi:hypothetical protein
MPNAAVQFNADPPLFVIVIGWETIPLETLNATAAGFTLSIGGTGVVPGVVPTVGAGIGDGVGDGIGVGQGVDVSKGDKSLFIGWLYPVA